MASKRKTRRRIQRILTAAVVLALIACALIYLPFPWYVHKELPITYFSSVEETDPETGILEVEGWMFFRLTRPDTFRGSVETLKGDAMYKRGEYQARLRVTFDQAPRPDVQLKHGYRTVHIDKVISCTGDVQNFIAYWLDADRSAIVRKAFDQVILQSTYKQDGQLKLKDYCVGPSTSGWTGSKVVEQLRTNNPDYPVFESE